jgi:Caspase domain
MFRRFAAAFAIVMGAVLATAVIGNAAAAADKPEKRVALVIGNSGYQSVAQLPNPARDADAVAKMFQDAKFDTVEVKLNLGIIDFKRTIRRFEDLADGADIAVIYYAGHGIEINGINYLIPVDARLANDRDAEDEAVPLDRVIGSAGGAKKFRLIILDACRDNPFRAGMKRDRRSATRSMTQLSSVDLANSTDTLTAYAAKLGSTAEDGDGDHSPFTLALLKNLTVPGLDVRMAFGRIKKEVMSATGGRQEPFVYGSLGDDNYSLVPAPVDPNQVSVAEQKADYDLIMSINTKKAWEVFLTRYKAGPYVDQARVQLASLSSTIPPMPSSTGQENRAIAAAAPNAIAPGREPTSQEALEWNKVKDSSDTPTLQKFIQRFPNSPLANYAQARIDVLNRAAQERAEKERADREAALKAAEQARLEAARIKAEQEAAKKRDDEQRRVAEQAAKAAEAERRAAEAKARADDAARGKAAADAETLRHASEQQAKQAEQERQKANQAASLEAVCKQEQDKLDQLTARGSSGNGLNDMSAFARTVTCPRLGGVVVANVEKFTAESRQQAATAPNSPELLRAAQSELSRVSCFGGKIDGSLTTTQDALGRYRVAKGQKAATNDVTQAVVDDLTKQSGRICPLECDVGQTAKDGLCVANAKPAEPATASRRKDKDEDRKPAPRQAEREQPRQQQVRPAPRPAAQQQAVARPSYGGGGGGGGGHTTMVGVGF